PPQHQVTVCHDAQDPAPILVTGQLPIADHTLEIGRPMPRSGCLASAPRASPGSRTDAAGSVPRRSADLAVIPGGSANGSAACSRLLVTAPARSRVRGLNSANEGSGSSWSRFCIPGGQGVAGSNPAVPTGSLVFSKCIYISREPVKEPISLR